MMMKCLAVLSLFAILSLSVVLADEIEVYDADVMLDTSLQEPAIAVIDTGESIDVRYADVMLDTSLQEPTIRTWYILTVSVFPSNGGYVELSRAGGLYDEGTVVTVTAIAKDGYVFSHWSGDASGTNPTIQITMDSDKNVVANFELINNPPEKPSSPYPANGAINVSITTTLSWQCSDMDNDALTYDVYFGTSSNPPKVANGISTNSYNPGTLQYSTTYYWKVVVWDEHGAKNESEIWHFTTLTNPSHENIPPTIKINYPANGSTVYGALIIKGVANDEDGSIIKVEIRIDGGEWKEANGTISWSYELDTTELDNGFHIIEARSYDGINYSEIAKITVNVNNIGNIPPKIEILSPENGSTVKGSIIIQGKAWDEDGNESLVRVEISIDKGGWKEVTGTVNWTCSLDTTKLSNGEHLIEARSYDGINYSEIAKIIINVQNEGKEREALWFAIGVIIAIAIAVIAIAWYMKKK